MSNKKLTTLTLPTIDGETTYDLCPEWEKVENKPTNLATTDYVDNAIPDVPTKVSELTNDIGFKTTDNNTTYTFATGDSNGQFKVTPNPGNAYNVSIKGLGSAAYVNINDMSLITIAEIDAICSASITMITEDGEVEF